VETEAGLTMTGDFLGTLRYMSPEQALGRKGAIDYRSDIYSLGITLYELLTLAPAFPGTDRGQFLRQVAHDEPKPPRQVNPQIPRDLETIVLKAIDKEPAFRYASAGELSADLRRYLQNEPVKARRPTIRQRLWKWAFRHRGLVIGTLLMLLMATGIAGVGGAMVLTERQRRETAEQQQFYEQQIREQQDAVIAQNEETARVHRYVADINLAWQAWNRSKIDEMHKYLLRCIPEREQSDLRSFEWHYLWKLCHSLPKPIGRHLGPAYFAAFAPDEKTFATGGSDGVRLWDTATGQQLRHLNAHKGDVNWVNFSPDGKLMATASDDRTVHLWDTRSWKIQRSFRTKRLAIAAQFSPDGKLLAIAEKVQAVSRDNCVTVHATDGWRKLKLFDFDGNYSEVRGVCFSRDSARMAAFSENSYIEFRKLPQFRYVGYVGGIAAYRCGDFDPNGDLIAIGCGDGFVRFYGTGSSNSKPFPPLLAHSSIVESVAYSRDGGLLVTAARDGTARLWMRNEDGRVSTVPDRTVRHFAPLWNARISKDNHTLLVVDQKGNVFRHDLRQRMRYEPPRIHGGSRTCAFSFIGDGPSFAMLLDEYVVIRSASTGRILESMRNLVPEQNSLAASPDGSLLAVGSTRGEIVLIDCARKRAIRRWTLQPLPASATPQIEALKFSPDGRLLAPSGVNFRPVFLDVHSDTSDSVYDVPEEMRRTVAWFPDGRLVMDLRSGFVAWDPVTGTITPLGNVGSWLSDIDWSQDGSLMAAMYLNGLIRIWNGKTMQERTSWIADQNGAASVAVTPDGRTVATAGANGGIRLWNVATGREYFALPMETSVRDRLAVKFSRDSRTLAGLALQGPERQLRVGIRLWSARGAPGPPSTLKVAE
jgi:WD40 repeat protein